MHYTQRQHNYDKEKVDQIAEEFVNTQVPKEDWDPDLPASEDADEDEADELEDVMGEHDCAYLPGRQIDFREEEADKEAEDGKGTKGKGGNGGKASEAAEGSKPVGKKGKGKAKAA